MKKYNKIDMDKSQITGGFWSERECLNSQTTIKAVYDRFKDTGRIDAFKCEWKEGMPKRPHFFWDSDVAKWIESVAYITQKNKNENLEKLADSIIDDMEKNQGEDGYFNIYYTVVEPGKRFTVRDHHELYCAGHLTEAAIAYYLATGKDKMLKCMEKYINYIHKVFFIDKSATYNTPGHEEIEVSLVKLYNLTKNEKYLELAEYFLYTRGKTDEDGVMKHESEFQDHLPVTEQTTAEGHAVRACYLYTGMAMYAREKNDEAMFDACKKLFSNIVNKRMYITGGIGSTYARERFTYDYDLPNAEAYSESCAAISLAFFAHKMSLIDDSAEYANIIERILYNGFLSSTSLDGKAFFYENPLEIDPRKRFEKNVGRHLPITQRVEVFDCSCCPPNITRFIPQVSEFIYKTSDNEIFIEQFISSKATLKMNENDIEIETDADIFYGKKMNVKVKNADGLTLKVRKPLWIEKISSNTKYFETNGYLVFELKNEQEIKIDFDFSVKLNYSNPKVVENAGKTAVSYGPVVYCLEAVDNGEDLRNIYIDESINFSVENESFCGFPIIEASAFRPKQFDELYRTENTEYEPQKIKLIPYFAFANRGESEMLVWMMKK